MGWRRVACGCCPHCASSQPKLILGKNYIRREYKTIFVVQCERCGYVFEHVRDGKRWAELRKKYRLSRREESIIRRQAAQQIIYKLAVEKKMPTKDDLHEVEREVERLAHVAKMLRQAGYE